MFRSGYSNNPGNLSGDSIMLNDFNCSCPVYIACGYTDLRRGIDGLAGIVQSQFQMDPFQRAMFLFCGRKRDRLKALYWEGDGFLLLYKTAGTGQLSMAEDEEGGPSADITTVPMAHGRAEYRAAEGAQASDRAEHDIIVKTIENAGLSGIFVIK